MVAALIRAGVKLARRAYTKVDGKTIQATEKQIAAWEKRKSGAKATAKSAKAAAKAAAKGKTTPKAAPKAPTKAQKAKARKQAAKDLKSSAPKDPLVKKLTKNPATKAKRATSSGNKGSRKSSVKMSDADKIKNADAIARSLAKAGVDQKQFNKVFDSLGDKMSLKELSRIAHQYRGGHADGRKSHASKSDAKASIKSWFSHVSYQRLKLQNIRQSSSKAATTKTPKYKRASSHSKNNIVKTENRTSVPSVGGKSKKSTAKPSSKKYADELSAK